MSRIVLAEAYRTPIGVFGGVFKDIPAYELGATVIRQILEHSQIDPNEINEVILGNVLQAGQGQNPARIAAIHGGVPEAVPSFTVNKVLIISSLAIPYPTLSPARPYILEKVLVTITL